MVELTVPPRVIVRRDMRDANQRDGEGCA